MCAYGPQAENNGKKILRNDEARLLFGNLYRY